MHDRFCVFIQGQLVYWVVTKLFARHYGLPSSVMKKRKLSFQPLFPIWNQELSTLQQKPWITTWVNYLLSISPRASQVFFQRYPEEPCCIWGTDAWSKADQETILFNNIFFDCFGHRFSSSRLWKRSTKENCHQNSSKLCFITFKPWHFFGKKVRCVPIFCTLSKTDRHWLFVAIIQNKK